MGVRGELFSSRVILQNRTYFFNVKENRLGDLYLNIVESKNRDEGGFERQSVILFADDLQEFLKGFDESLRVMEKAVREKKKGAPGKNARQAGASKRDEYAPKRDEHITKRDEYAPGQGEYPPRRESYGQERRTDGSRPVSFRKRSDSPRQSGGDHQREFKPRSSPRAGSGRRSESRGSSGGAESKSRVYRKKDSDSRYGSSRPDDRKAKAPAKKRVVVKKPYPQD